MRNFAKPSFKYRTTALVSLYKKAASSIMREIEKRDAVSINTANSRAILSDISKTIIELDKGSEEWVKENIPKSAREGIARSLVSLGVVETLKEAETIVKFNKLNKNMIESAVADTYQDLAQVTQNIDKKAKVALRKVISESMKEQYVKGVTGSRTMKRKTLNKLYEDLDEIVNTGFIDSAGRRWRAETYVEMVAHEKMNQTYFEANTNEAIARGAYYGIISSHGATDACRYHEGRIVKLDEDAPGDYPTVDELQATGQIFHVRCLHQVSVLSDPSMLPESVLEKADKQEEIGRKAVTAGGRDPDV